MDSELQKHTSKLAVVSMILGVLSIIPIILDYYPLVNAIPEHFGLFSIVVAIIAFALGLVALIRIIRKSNLKGLVFAILGLAFSGTIILMFIAIFMALSSG